MHKIVLVLLVVILFSGCDQANEKIAERNLTINPFDAKEEIYLSDLVDSVKYIPLETNSNVTLGRIHSLFIKNKFIYVKEVSQQAIFVFDLSGKFVSKLQKLGNGAGEYRYIRGFVVDDEENYIEIIALSSGKEFKRLRYSNINFNLIEEQEFPFINGNSIRKSKDYYFVSTQQNDNFVNGKRTNAGVLVLQGNEIINTLFDKKIETNNRYYTYNSESFTVNDEGEIFVSVMFDNTFYKLQGQDAIPVLKLDFGNYGINNSVGLKSTTEQLEYLKSVENSAFLPVLDIYNADVISFSYNFKKNGTHYVNQYIKLREANKVFHGNIIKNNLTNYPHDLRLCSYCAGFNYNAYYKGNLVYVINPGNHLVTEGKNIINIDGLGKVSVEDNPVIMLMKLKKSNGSI